MAKLEFLGWDKPVVDLVADWLLARREDLPGMCVVVPTTHSGRRLRERMTQKAGAVLSPEMVTPAMILKADPGESAPSWLEILAWCEALEGVAEWADYQALFPQTPDVAGGNSLPLAKELHKLGRRLQENGHTMASAARVLGSSHDGERWVALAGLESLFRKKLRSWGWSSRSEVLAAKTPHSLPHREYVLAGVSDMPRLAVRLFQESDKPVTALIAAPAEMASHFDGLGLPGNSWNTLPMPWPEQGKGSVSLVSDTRTQAQEALARIHQKGLASDQVALGTGDPEIAAELVRALGANGWAAFDPSPSTTSTGLRRWLRAWRQSLGDPSFAALQDLLSLPESDLFAPAKKRLTCLHTLNRKRDKDMLSSVEDLPRMTRSADVDSQELMHVVDAVMAQRKNFLERTLSDSLADILERMPLAKQDPDAGPIRAWIEDAEPMIRRIDRSPGFWLELMLDSLPASSPNPPTDRAIDVLGWLELPYETGLHLVVCGMNEGMVPSQVPADPWLGESASKILGLPTNESRAARDSYLARYLVECRKQGGHVDWICGKTNGSGDTLLPSRILLSATGDELARRVKHLFRDIPPAEAGIRWHADWQWLPSRLPHREQIRVTSFKDWLACPFRYYLKHVVRMQEPEPDRMEWNARDYGTIFHEVVETWGRDEDAREFSKTEALSAWFSDCLDRLVAKRFGNTPSLAIRMQAESLRSRLEWLAHEQTLLRASGWRVIDVESPFELQIGTWTIRGQIDRIDEHPDYGLRVIDYKTSADLGKVAAEHCSKITAKTNLLEHWGKESPVFFTGEEKGKPQTMRWTNLQLPLYTAAILERTGKQATPCYIGVGTSREKVKVEAWEDFTESHLASARACAEWIIGQISAGVFWPPAEKPAYRNDMVSALSCGRPPAEMFAWNHEPSA